MMIRVGEAQWEKIRRNGAQKELKVKVLCYKIERIKDERDFKENGLMNKKMHIHL